MEEKREKSRVLIMGGTGKLGYELAKACSQFSHPTTFILVRDSAFSDSDKTRKLQSLSNAGATLLKVYLFSQFGLDPDKIQVGDLDNNFYANKTVIHRIVEAEGIPYTYISCNFFISYLLPSLVQPGLKTPPRDKATNFVEGNSKGVFMKKSDVASFTIRTVDDPQTLNKALYLRPPVNVYSLNELVEAWETKTGIKLRTLYVSEEELLQKIKETPYPDNMSLVFIYSAFIKGDRTYSDIDSSMGEEGTKLYPELTYTTISQFLDTLV